MTLISLLQTNILAANDANSPFIDWKGTSVVFVGDSITYGSGTNKTYQTYIKEMEVFESVQAMGVAGSCFSSQSDYGYNCAPLIKRYSSIPDADLIVIFMGTNDYGHETPLGSLTDTTDISFYGALNVIIPGIQAQHPDSQLVFVTPLHRYGFGTSKISGIQFTYDHIANARGCTLSDYVEAIITVCEKYSVPIIDLFNTYPIDPSDSSDRTAYIPDGLHPNAIGHEIIANLIFLNLQTILNKNDDNTNKPAEHTHSYTAIDVTPTCTEQGYTIFICKCGDMIKDNFTEKSDHSYNGSVCKTCNYKCSCKCHYSGFMQIIWNIFN